MLQPQLLPYVLWIRNLKIVCFYISFLFKIWNIQFSHIFEHLVFVHIFEYAGEDKLSYPLPFLSPVYCSQDVKC